MRRINPSLHTRISLVLTALASVLVLALGGLWLKQSHEAIHEEVEAATRVAGQWLSVAASEARAKPPTWSSERLLAHIRAVGRIRANELVVADSAGRLLYRSPQPTYKAGRAAPGWFAALVEPDFAERRIDAGPLTLILRPDASRATLDAWDELCVIAGWAALLLVALFFAARLALDRALRPLGLVMAALARTGSGCFDTRLPVFPVPELGRLAGAFNGMADRLAQAVNENVRLETEQERLELIERVQQRLEADRRGIARELHDELAQGITAVRALAGAIAQRTGEQPALHGYAQSIVEVTGQMQDGVRNILTHLRPPAALAQVGIDATLRRYLDLWQQHYPDIALDIFFDSALDAGAAPVGDDLAQALLRVVQEGLTNVARHAAASRVEVRLCRFGGWLELTLTDNGCGPGAASTFKGCGLGMAGMRERVAALSGEIDFSGTAGHGSRLQVRLPAIHVNALEEAS